MAGKAMHREELVDSTSPGVWFVPTIVISVAKDTTKKNVASTD